MKDRLKALRKELGLTQERFAERLRMKRNSIANYEIGRNEPIDAVISLICKEFNVNEEWLRTGKGPMYNIQKDDYTKIAVDIDKNDPRARKIIMDYWNLSSNDKKLFMDFMERFTKMNGEE